MKTWITIQRARIARWWYLLRAGMYKGEVAMDYFDKDGKLIGLYSGKMHRLSWLDPSERVWWHR
jgi:hypothetical protein